MFEQVSTSGRVKYGSSIVYLIARTRHYQKKIPMSRFRDSERSESYKVVGTDKTLPGSDGGKF